jgi:hypothetical protein
MTFDHLVSLVSACISFAGLIFVALQLRDSNRQRESESIVKLYDINRELLSLAFSHPSLFDVLEDKPIKDHLSEKRYLQLWLNQLSLSHTFLRHAVVQTEYQDELTRNLEDFMSMQNMRKHWQTYGPFYPESFQNRVKGILEKDEPPVAATHPGNTRQPRDSKT